MEAAQAAGWRIARATVAVVVAFLIVLVGAAAASAETIRVTTGGDTGTPEAGEPSCTLREAINWSNAGGGTQLPPPGCVTDAAPAGANVISLDAPPQGGQGNISQYSIATTTAENNNAGGDFDIKASVSIVGKGPSTSWIDGGQLDRVFDIAEPNVNTPVVVNISGVTIRRGRTANASSGAGGAGGGIRNEGHLTLTDCVVTDSGTGRGGSGAGGGQGGQGGGIYSLSDLTLTDCIVRENTAGNGGDGAAGTGGWGGGAGGGIASYGPLSLSNTTVTQNRSGNGGAGGAASDAPNASGGPGGLGAGVLAGNSTTIRNSAITDNSAGDGGAGGNATGGPGVHAGNGGAGGWVGGVVVADDLVASPVLSIENTTIARNSAGDGGAGGEVTAGGAGSAGAGGAGGIAGGLLVNVTKDTTTATITSSSISANAAGAGGAAGSSAMGPQGRGGAGGSAGGLLTANPGTVQLTGSTVADNVAGSGGAGGIGGAGANAGNGGDGGGVTNIGAHLQMATSTVSGNRAGMGGASNIEAQARGGHGGGVYAGGGDLTIVNSTLSGNTAGRGGESKVAAARAGSGGSGGAIEAAAGSVSVASATLASNAVGPGGEGAQPGPTGGGGAIAGTLTLTNSLLTSNGDSGCAGTVTDGGHNLAFPASGCPGVVADPQLGPLADNGGPTRTHALGAGSAARDQVPASGAGCQPIDQRGVARPKGSACDIGAFEADPVAPPGGNAPQAQAPDVTAPLVTDYGLASRTIVAFPNGGSVARATRGTTVSYTVSEAGLATFTVRRVRPGRRRGKRCVRPTKRNRHARKCTRLATVGSFTRPSTAGASSFRFTGRVKDRALKPGRYRLVLVVADAAGNRSKPKSVSFRVVKRA